MHYTVKISLLRAGGPWRGSYPKSYSSTLQSRQVVKIFLASEYAANFLHPHFAKMQVSVLKIRLWFWFPNTYARYFGAQ